MENAHLLKKYILPYTSCITCAKKKSEITTETTTDKTNFSNICADHNEFENFFVEQHMIPIIMQQFLIDLDARSSSKMIAKPATNDNELNAFHSIDFNEIKLFWNDYICIIPHDLNLIWDTIANGLLLYLQVCCKIEKKFRKCMFPCCLKIVWFCSFQILKRRRKQIYECNILRQQNAELRNLLQQYCDTKRRIIRISNCDHTWARS